MKKGIIYRLSPLNNETNMSASLYVIKKALAFILIYDRHQHGYGEDQDIP